MTRLCPASLGMTVICATAASGVAHAAGTLLPEGVYVETFDYGQLLSTVTQNPGNLDAVDPVTWFGGGVVVEYEAADPSAGYSDLGVLEVLGATGDGGLVDVVANETALGGTSNAIIRLVGCATSFEAELAVQNGVMNDFSPYGEGTGVTVDLFLGTSLVGSTDEVILEGLAGPAMLFFDAAPFDTIVFRTSVETLGAGDNGLDTYVVRSMRLASGSDDVRGDLDGDGAVGFGDLTQLLGSWGVCPICAGDLDGNGTVGFTDLTELLGLWGP